MIETTETAIADNKDSMTLGIEELEQVDTTPKGVEAIDIYAPIEQDIEQQPELSQAALDFGYAQPKTPQAQDVDNLRRIDQEYGTLKTPETEAQVVLALAATMGDDNPLVNNLAQSKGYDITRVKDAEGNIHLQISKGDDPLYHQPLDLNNDQLLEKAATYLNRIGHPEEAKQLIAQAGFTSWQDAII